jgi:hypothetical protein
MHQRNRPRDLGTLADEDRTPSDHDPELPPARLRHKVSVPRGYACAEGVAGGAALVVAGLVAGTRAGWTFYILPTTGWPFAILVVDGPSNYGARKERRMVRYAD